MAYNTRDMNDIHQSNNVSNATQERLQESSEEPEMRDNSCQTRESLFEARISDNGVPLGFTTFGVRGPSSQNGTNHLHHHRHHHLHHHQSPPQSRQSSLPSQHSASQQCSEQSSQQVASQCSGCSPASRGRDGSMGICPKHNPIPAPPGWSTHESNYPSALHQGTPYPEPPDYPSYQRFQSPKPSRENSAYRQSPKLLRQGTAGSGERYGSSIYGSGHGSSNTSSAQHSGTPKCSQTTPDPRYRAEAVIEVDQRRPFSIESTKSAPDVIATHWRRGPGDWEPYKRRHPRQTVTDHQLPARNDGNKVTVATQSSLDDDASTSSTIEANSSSWSTHTGAIDRSAQSDQDLSDQDDRRPLEKSGRSVRETERRNDVSLPRSTEIGKIKESDTRPGNNGEIGGTEANELPLRDSVGTNTGTLHGDVTILHSTGIESMESVPVARTSPACLALKPNDLPILRPPEAFGAPIFRCKTPTLAWQHCDCPSHSHLPPRRSSVIWSVLKRYNQEPFYRTWPNRTDRRFVRPSRRTVGTQSTFGGSRSSLGGLRCVVRSIDMTERSMDLEIGATIPF